MIVRVSQHCTVRVRRHGILYGGARLAQPPASAGTHGPWRPQLQQQQQQRCGGWRGRWQLVALVGLGSSPYPPCTRGSEFTLPADL